VTNSAKTLLFLAKEIMPLCWLYAWGAFSLAAIFKHPFPLFGALAAYLTGAGTAIVTSRRGWRIITVLALNSAAMLLACLGIVYAGDAGPYPFFGTAWLPELIGRSRTPIKWCFLAVLLIWGIVFWIAGSVYARRPPTYRRVANSFDLGCTAFLALMLLKLLILIKGGLQVPDPLSVRLLFPFFLFSLVALGLARQQSRALKDYMVGFRGIAIIASFAGVVLLLGSGVFALMLPYLTTAAEMGYDMVKKGSAPLFPVLVAILRFIFGARGSRPQPMQTKADQRELAPIDFTQADPQNSFLVWVFSNLVVLLVLACAAGIFYLLLRWLFSLTTAREKTAFDWGGLFKELAALFKKTRAFLGRLYFQIGAVKEAPFYFGKLAKWGRNSGVPRRFSETPNEYGRRLERRFPALKPQIRLIIECFNQQVYAGNRSTAALKPAWRKLRSPTQWPVRIKARLMSPEPH
jgi:Ca2+/Na+ antiporter